MRRSFFKVEIPYKVGKYVCFGIFWNTLPRRLKIANSSKEVNSKVTRVEHITGTKVGTKLFGQNRGDASRQCLHSLFGECFWCFDVFWCFWWLVDVWSMFAEIWSRFWRFFCRFFVHVFDVWSILGLAFEPWTNMEFAYHFLELY